MAGSRVNRVLCAAEPRGSAEAIRRLGEVADEEGVEAICLVGDLAGQPASQEGYRAVFQALGRIGLPAYWVPGPDDAPVAEYLREAHNMEVVFPFLHGVHGTAAYAPDGHLVFAGLGGEVGDDPDDVRDEMERLSYPRWEAEYHLKVLNELDEHMLMLLFATPPEHKGQGREGSDVVHEMVGTLRPRAVVCAGERGSELVGRTIVVSPGTVADGEYAIVDIHKREAEFGSFEPAGRPV